ncbi:MAG: glycosyltransferase family 2 protein [Saprospiraceae bacterium]|nr:glycosyltransferase family 2 protein [Saprospiraceae bacterium]MCF8251070.1 glycosyltransferase family 2 protein [Saprospiraceae bacterium]MCF8280355.1 glycosyltransferase family 2 protein [Bacteroidales bacterium]MCF8312874.1 glycosyltransferase family 2 protein [Saprospiraceae bacterium]MCF8441329.1 glycosyltransferase family 2 protein [Saprospiraceae bacterium]
MKLSVVITVYNEEENIRPLFDQLVAALQGIDYEIIYVDDGSRDSTLSELKKLKHDRLRFLEFRKNYGQSMALMAGIDHAEGDFIATMDGDLQNDPADLPAMLQLAEEGDWDLVAGIRANRKDGMVLRKIPSLIANWIIRTSTDVHLKDYGCALKVFRADIAKDLGLYGELHRFIPVLARLEGARITQLDVRHHARQFGKSKYGLGRTFKVVSDLLLMLFMKKYLQRPMHLFGNVGVGIFSIGVLINIYLGILKFTGHDIWGKPLLILGLMLVLAGIQLITIGIVVEIQMRTYYESQQKRPYKVRREYHG